MLSWQSAIALRVLIANFAVPVLIKQQADRVDGHTRFLLQFLIAALFSSGLFLCFSDTFEWKVLVATAALGAMTVAGTFFQWKAVAISGSKTSVLAFMDDVIAIALSVIFLSEWERVTPLSLTGVTLCAASLIGFIARARAKEQDVASEKTPMRFFFYVALYSVVWGLSYFLQKVYAVQAIGMLNLIGGWYIGGLISAWLLVRFVAKEKHIWKKVSALTPKDVFAVAVLALLIVAAMCLAYITFQGVIQFAAQPVFMIGEMVLQAAVFMIVFRKRKNEHFDRYEAACATLAVIGTSLIMGFQV
jgi:hypothetical protein